MKLLFVTFLIKGLNVDRLIESLKRRSFTLYDIKKIDQRTLYLTVKRQDSKKIFAISKDLCYNIRKVKEGGALFPVFYLLKNVGLIIGFALFIGLSVFFNDVIFEISYTGSGAVYKREVEEYLSARGVEKRARFSKLQLSYLSSDIMASTPHLSFVSCTKKGNTLVIDLELANEKQDYLTGNETALISSVDGIVESVKAYRGTAVVKAGDKVSVGDVIIDGVATIKEQTINVNVIGTAVIKTRATFNYTSTKENQEEYFRLLSENELKEEIIDENISSSCIDGKYYYKVELYYRRVIFAG